MADYVRKTGVCVSLAACLWAFLGGFGHAVICFGEDGHVAIEVANSDCCDSRYGMGVEHSFESFEFSAVSAPPGHCGSCVDIPLSNCRNIRLDALGPKKSQSVQSSALESSVLRCLDFRSHSGPAAFTTEERPEIAFISTFVLLI